MLGEYPHPFWTGEVRGKDGKTYSFMVTAPTVDVARVRVEEMYGAGYKILWIEKR